MIFIVAIFAGARCPKISYLNKVQTSGHEVLKTSQPLRAGTTLVTCLRLKLEGNNFTVSSTQSQRLLLGFTFSQIVVDIRSNTLFEASGNIPSDQDTLVGDWLDLIV